MSDPAAWFARRTSRASDVDPQQVARSKAASGTTVSVVVPAKDEAATIGAVVDHILASAGTLVDELVVMDGESRDATATIAARRGARVHTDRAVLPELGPALGKGDALWRSLAVTSGHLVVFVDADLVDPSPNLVAGLVAPLLEDPGVHLVKAFYERALGTAPTGGGRVTELTARPLLNLLWPELAGVVQPLAGEYAGRRAHLEAIPFLTGYAVELGLLIDTFLTAGLDAIAQVDLGVRAHRNRDLSTLSRMAFEVAQAAVRRLPEAGRGQLPPPPARYLQPGRDASGDPVLPDPTTIRVLERPPLHGRRTHS